MLYTVNAFASCTVARDWDETGSILALEFRLSGITAPHYYGKSKFQVINITENNFVQSISHFEKISRL